MVPHRLAILAVADNRPAACGKVYAYLVCAAGDESAAEQGEPDRWRFVSANALEHSLAGRTRTSLGDFRASPLAAARQADVDHAARDVDPSIDDRQILFFRLGGRQRSLKGRVNRARLGDDKDS